MVREKLPWRMHIFFLQCKQDGCRRQKNTQSIPFTRKESIGRSCLSFFMDSNFSLVAAFVVAGNEDRDCERFSAICEGLLKVHEACVAPFACRRKVSKRSAGNASEPIREV